MTDLTTLLQIPYPSEYDDPYRVSAEVLYDSLDKWVQANQEDKMLHVSGGGTMTLVANTFTWSQALLIRSLRSGALITVAPSSLTVADGEVVYVVASARPLITEARTLVAGAPAHTNRNLIPLGVRSGTSMYMFNTAESSSDYLQITMTNASYTIKVADHRKFFAGIPGSDDPVIFKLPLNPPVGFEVAIGVAGISHMNQIDCQGAEDILLIGGGLVTTLQSNRMGSGVKLLYAGGNHWAISRGTGIWKDVWATPTKQLCFEGNPVFDNRASPYSTGSVSSGGGTHTHEFAVDGLQRGLMQALFIELTSGTSTDVTIQFYDDNPATTGVLIYEVPNHDFVAEDLDDRNAWFVELIAANSLWLKVTNDGVSVATLAVGFRIRGE